jgi:CubicO group peptidase (beta-lactamase class C family)
MYRMTQREEPFPGELYYLKNSISLRVAGLRETYVVAGIAEDGSHIAVEGTVCGRIEIPISSITHVRLGCRPGGPRKFFKCTIRRESGWPVAVYGTHPWSDYAGFVRHLAREMERLGRFDRIERGLPVLHALFILLVCQVALLFPGFLTWLWWEYGWKFEPRHYLYAIGLALPWIGVYFWGLWIWRRRYWPRPARDMNDLNPMLPSDRKPRKVLGIPLY